MLYIPSLLVAFGLQLVQVPLWNGDSDGVWVVGASQVLCRSGQVLCRVDRGHRNTGVIRQSSSFMI